MTESVLTQITSTPWLADLLANQFDFDLTRTDPLKEVHLAGGEPLTAIAGDNTGGAFLLTASGALVYAGSEGEGGLIAHHLRDALALIVGLPSLHDALPRPLGDELYQWLATGDDEIRANDLERGLDWLALDTAREVVCRTLNLPTADGLLADLHAAARDESYRPINSNGDTYGSMLQQ